MTARRLADGPESRVEAARVLATGGIVAFPTDTVYGIAVALETPGGIERLFAAKGRPPERAIALLLADTAQAREIGELNAAASALAGAFWPGGLTLVVPRRADRPLLAALTGRDSPDVPTVGLRVPDHATPRALAAAVGPLPTTSANRSGGPDPLDAASVIEELGDGVDLVLDGGRTAGSRPSTVVDLTVDPPAVVRVGGIDEARIRAVLAGIRPA